MTSAERAKDLLKAIADQGTGGWRFAAEIEEALPLITQAITAAEQDALSEAAREVGRYADNFHQVSKHRSALLSAIVTIQQVAERRSLKSKD